MFSSHQTTNHMPLSSHPPPYTHKLAPMVFDRCVPGQRVVASRVLGCTNGPRREAGEPVHVISNEHVRMRGMDEGRVGERTETVSMMPCRPLTVPDMKPTVVILILILIVFLKSFMVMHGSSQGNCREEE